MKCACSIYFFLSSVNLIRRGMDISKYNYFRESLGENNDEFGFNDPSTHEGHLHQKGILTWFSTERAVKIKRVD